MEKNESFEPDRIQYLQMIQDMISRMSTSSALFKGFSATIVAGISMISYCQQNIVVILLSFVPVAVFAILDIYYLRLERKMRYLYGLVREGNHICDFNMEFEVEKAKYKNAGMRGIDLIKSPSIYIFYPAMIMILIIVLGMKIGGII